MPEADEPQPFTDSRTGAAIHARSDRPLIPRMPAVAACASGPRRIRNAVLASIGVVCLALLLMVKLHPLHETIAAFRARKSVERFLDSVRAPEQLDLELCYYDYTAGKMIRNTVTLSSPDQKKPIIEAFRAAKPVYSFDAFERFRDPEKPKGALLHRFTVTACRNGTERTGELAVANIVITNERGMALLRDFSTVKLFEQLRASGSLSQPCEPRCSTDVDP